MAKHKIRTSPADEITVVIPSAGEGRRMKSYGPKSLIEVSGETILGRQINIIQKELGYVRFVIVTGFQCDKVMNYCPDYFIKLENENYEITNVCRSLSIALRAVQTNRVLIVYGDLIFNSQAISGLDYTTSCISANEDSYRNEEVGCIIDNENNITNMMYDLKDKWNQMIYLQGRELSLFKQVCQNRENKKLFGFEIINKVLDLGGQIKCVSDKQIKVIDIDTSKDLLRANDIQ